MNGSIPVIDVSLWSSDCNKQTEAHMSIAKDWNEAMKAYGCAVIIGHGIPERVFDTINAESHDFFSKGLDTKQSYNHGIYGNPMGGYTAPGREIVALSCEDDTSDRAKPKFDPVENFVFTTHPSKFKSPCGELSPIESASAYYESMESVLRNIHSLSCCALGISDLDYFQKFYDATLPGNSKLGINGNALRLAHYPPIDPIHLHGRCP